MKNIRLIRTAIAGATTLSVLGIASASLAATSVPLYRIYDANNGAHAYTESVFEKNSDVKAGWTDQGVAWYAPTSGGAAVYRVYNPNSGEHFYTESLSEKNSLVKVGWHYEGVSFRAATSGTPIYRLYNAKVTAGSHFWTQSLAEKNAFVKAGWKYEGIAWYGVKTTASTTNPPATSGAKTLTVPSNVGYKAFTAGKDIAAGNLCCDRSFGHKCSDAEFRILCLERFLCLDV